MLSLTITSGGYISAVHGDVVEIEFAGNLSPTNDALVVGSDERRTILEVSGHTSCTTVTSIAFGFTQGLRRGMTVAQAGGPLSVPVSGMCLGGAFNLFGSPIASLRSENWYRLRMMEGTSENLKRCLGDLGSLQKYARQEEITEEMLEILGSGAFYRRQSPVD
jgi:F0F1-type ATP synthase beta subunit